MQTATGEKFPAVARPPLLFLADPAPESSANLNGRQERRPSDNLRRLWRARGSERPAVRNHSPTGDGWPVLAWWWRQPPPPA